MKRFIALLMASVLIMGVWAPTAEAQGCRTHVSEYTDVGKTIEGFEATATDGCHTVKWSSSIGQGPDEGTVTFRVTPNVDSWAGDLPKALYNAMRAAHEANLWFLNYFKVPHGTEVTVRYVAD